MQDTDRTAGLIAAFAAWRSGPGAQQSKRIEDWQQKHFTEFLAKGFAKRTHEDWRYSNTSPLQTARHQISDSSSRLKLALTPGVEQTSLLSLLDADDKFRARFDAGIGQRSIFANLNFAFLQSGQMISVPSGYRDSAPQVLEHELNVAGEWSSQTQHWLIGEGAKVTVVEVIRGESDGTLNQLKRWQIMPRAHLTHIVLSLGAGHLNIVSRDEVTADAEGRYERYNVSLGQTLQRQEVSVQLGGREASCDIVQMHLIPGRTQAELLLDIDHQAENTKSQQLIKGLVDKGGLSHVTGSVHITEQAKGAEARQLIRHLLLGEKAEANAKPQLKIDTDDVVCSHGATVAQVNALELFYLMSRGISRANSLKLLSDAFAREVLWRGQHLNHRDSWDQGFSAAMHRFASRELLS